VANHLFQGLKAREVDAGNPPNTGATTFAIPWPISSWFELWRVPAIPSAITADNRDSIAPSIAIVKAGPINSTKRAAVISDRCTVGNPLGIPPNNETGDEVGSPMAATEQSRTARRDNSRRASEVKSHGARVHRHGDKRYGVAENRTRLADTGPWTAVEGPHRCDRKEGS
jgi:hypothetical protein